MMSLKAGHSQWMGCDYCKGDCEGYTCCFRDINGRSRKLYIPEGKAAIVAPGKYSHKFYIPVQYCPFCGRPLTEKAWAELERNLGRNQILANPPLTLDELRGMDGEPVWTERYGWQICQGIKSVNGILSIDAGSGVFLSAQTYGLEWLAYRRRPEEAQR